MEGIAGTEGTAGTVEIEGKLTAGAIGRVIGEMIGGGGAII
jgi:hypothetical protein